MRHPPRPAFRPLAWIAAVPWRAGARRLAIALRPLAVLGLSLLAWTARRAVRWALWTARRAVRWALWTARWVVRWAVRRPRRAFAGLAGGLTAVALVLLLRPEGRIGLQLSDSLECLALNIYHEARGEPDDGKAAVAHVVMNRVADPRFPNDVCAVVTQRGARFTRRCHFSWWCDGRSDRPADDRSWTESKLLARRILDGAVTDPTRGALWYHADTVDPRWRGNKVRGPKIGRHIFYARR